jgi:hypothetical protein
MNRIYFPDGTAREHFDQVMAFRTWLALPAGTRAAFRAAGDTLPVYDHSYVDSPRDVDGPRTDGRSYQEELEGLIEHFTYELCELCESDIDEHVIAPDPLGKPHLYCMRNGARVVPGEE